MNAVAEEVELNALLQGIDIPACPAILLDIDAELRKEAPNQREIARLVSQDVGLSGQLMQLANSPLFSTGRELTSIIQVLNVLGTRQLLNLIMAQLLKVALDAGDASQMERFWESSAQMARLTAELARRQRCIPADVAYTFGLFQNCGIPLIMKRFPESLAVIDLAHGSDFHEVTAVEAAALGTHHAVVGYFLARRWRLPDYVADAILHHHDPSVLDEVGSLAEQGRVLVALSVLADHLLALHRAGGDEHEWPRTVVEAASRLGLSLASADDLLDDLHDWLD